ncbi:MAG: type II toxin-antitoxin system CcdA family antitoxin [Euzebya sp.]
MPRVNVTIPDQVIAAARERGLNVSAIAAAALAAELERQDKIDRLRADLDALDAGLGPVPREAAEAAAAWVAGMMSPDRSDSPA